VGVNSLVCATLKEMPQLQSENTSAVDCCEISTEIRFKYFFVEYFFGFVLKFLLFF